MAGSLRAERRYEEAVTAYQRAIEVNPKDNVSYYSLGVTWEDLGRYEGAELAYRKAIELNQGDASAHSNLGLLLHEKFYRYSEAESEYRKAIAADPLCSNAYNNLGLLLLEDGSDDLELRVVLAVRSNYAPWARSDFTGFEVMLGDMATFTAPEVTCEKARSFWVDQAPPLIRGLDKITARNE